MSTHQFLIASYPKDFGWLRFCLKSLKRFCKGYLPPVVVVSREDVRAATIVSRGVYPEVKIGVEDGPAGLGNLRAQVAMCKSDIHCPAADFVYLLGSDCLAFTDFSPSDYFLEGKPLMLINSIDHLRKFNIQCLPWVRGVERALGFSPNFEYMRRLPIVYPREVFPAMRKKVEEVNKSGFEAYVYGTGRNEWPQNFSESNVLGAYAHKWMPETYYWACMDSEPWSKYRNAIIQFWSHGGLDKPMDRNFDSPGGTIHKTPRAIITQILGEC